MRLDVNLPGQLTVRQDFEAIAQFVDDTQIEQLLRREGSSFELLETAYVDDGKMLPEQRVREAALRQAPMQRHLTTLKATHRRIAADRLLSLGASARVFAASGAHAPADATLRFHLTRRGFEIAEVHLVLSVRSRGGSRPGCSVGCRGEARRS